MSADFALVAHAAQRHADVFTPCGFGDAFAQRRFAHPRGTDQAQNRTFQLIGAFLHGKVFQNALFDFFQAVVVFIEHQIGFG